MLTSYQCMWMCVCCLYKTARWQLFYVKYTLPFSRGTTSKTYTKLWIILTMRIREFPMWISLNGAHLADFRLCTPWKHYKTLIKTIYNIIIYFLVHSFICMLNAHTLRTFQDSLLKKKKKDFLLLTHDQSKIQATK